MLADYHVHTGYSDDSSYPLRQVALEARAARRAERGR